MTGRERVLNTLAFRGSDRIPLDIWVLPAARLAHGKAFTVPMHTRPLAFRPLSASRGLSREAPIFMARAATRTSGTKTSLFLNFSPTTFMTLSRPSYRSCWAGMP